jgi:hypothetical protein
MPDQNIGNIGLEEALNFLLQRFREYKEEVQVSNGRYVHSWSCFCVFAKGEIR